MTAPERPDTSPPAEDDRPTTTAKISPPDDGLDLHEGRLIDDKYRLSRQIGHGGMGAVWEAEHEALGRRVAVKFLKPWTHSDESMASRFASEARIVAAIKHRFVVDVFDFGITDDGLYYMVLELLDGETLATRMGGLPPLSAREAIQLVADCLRGLHAVHEAGVVHRDLKPENVFVIRDVDGMYPKLIDFGISKRDLPAVEDDEAERRKSRLTQPGTVIGTVAYMPPEQLRGRGGVDRRADVYAMGVILYELLSGRLPYTDDNVADLMVAITNHGAPPLSRTRPDLGVEISNVIARALSASADARYATALAMREGLLAALSSVPAQARTGLGEGGTGRGHETELQLQAAAVAFGESARGFGARRRWLWIGLAAGGAILLAWALTSLGSSPNAPPAGATHPQPSAAAVPAVPKTPVVAAPAPEPVVSDPPADAPKVAEPAEPAEPARQERRDRASAKPESKPKGVKAKASPGAATRKKLYRELDF